MAAAVTVAAGTAAAMVMAGMEPVVTSVAATEAGDTAARIAAAGMERVDTTPASEEMAVGMAGTAAEKALGHAATAEQR